jgi:hypothetical protein
LKPAATDLERNPPCKDARLLRLLPALLLHLEGGDRGGASSGEHSSKHTTKSSATLSRCSAAGSLLKSKPGSPSSAAAAQRAAHAVAARAPRTSRTAAAALS